MKGPTRKVHIWIELMNFDIISSWTDHPYTLIYHIYIYIYIERGCQAISLVPPIIKFELRKGKKNLIRQPNDYRKMLSTARDNNHQLII
jgi:hypothetical protein